MRRILNLNQPATILLKVIGLLVVVIPAVLYSLLFLWNEPKVAGVLLSAIQISFIVGGITFVALTILIIVEQIQDHYFDIQYQKSRAQKLPLANGNYECQYCGNQMVKELDKTCRVCGKELKPVQSKLAK